MLLALETSRKHGQKTKDGKKKLRIQEINDKHRRPKEKSGNSKDGECHKSAEEIYI